MSPNDPNATVTYKPTRPAKETTPMAAAAPKSSTEAKALADAQQVEQAIARALGANLTVPIGPSEVTSVVVILAGLATSFFGHDWGLATNAQALGVVVSGAVAIGMAIARAIKHHAVLATVRAAVTKT